MNSITDTIDRPAPRFADPSTGDATMIRRLISALRRATGLHPRRRAEDRPRTLTARELIDEGLREMIRNPGRRHDDVLGQVRAQAEHKRRASDRAQLPLFSQEDAG